MAEANGCVSCHVEGAGVVAPAWEGLLGSEVTLDDGTVVTVDRDYLRRAIVDPGFDVVAGYTVRMPTVLLSDEEVDALVTYIESLTP
ncbi:MAG: cytochrome c [Acidimicrobiales bacterium]